MTPHRTGRGRPKGTGLDDTTHLQAIADMIAANPDLKPTTAIRDLGISDPSVIRRLRDKYHASRDQRCGAPAAAVAAVAQASPASPARSIAAAQSKDHRLSAPAVAPAEEAEPGPEPTPAARAGRSDPHRNEVSFAKLFGLGVGLFVTSIEAQASILAYFLRHPPAGAYYQSQVAFAEAALSFIAEVVPTPVSLA